MYLNLDGIGPGYSPTMLSPSVILNLWPPLEVSLASSIRSEHVSPANKEYISEL